MEIVDPRGRLPAAAARGLAARGPRHGQALRLGFLVNESSRNQGPDFFGWTLGLERALRARGRLGEVVRVCKPLLSRPAEPALLQALRNMEGVVNGLGK